jgi:hypothetical protein
MAKCSEKVEQKRKRQHRYRYRYRYRYNYKCCFFFLLPPHTPTRPLFFLVTKEKKRLHILTIYKTHPNIKPFLLITIINLKRNQI